MSDPIANPLPFASGENGIIKSPKDLLVFAEKKIGELENEGREAGLIIEQLKWQNAQLRVAVTALGNHFNCPPSEAKPIIDKFMAEQEEEFLKQNDEAKKKFIQDAKDGKAPEFKTVPNPDAKS